MCQADSEAFASFAHAQVTVTNEIYQFLGEPDVFLFCPTGRPKIQTWQTTIRRLNSVKHCFLVLLTLEYCGSLCSPSVSKSHYLQTIGEDLLPDITVIWTGKTKTPTVVFSQQGGICSVQRDLLVFVDLIHNLLSH